MTRCVLQKVCTILPYLHFEKTFSHVHVRETDFRVHSFPLLFLSQRTEGGREGGGRSVNINSDCSREEPGEGTGRGNSILPLPFPAQLTQLSGSLSLSLSLSADIGFHQGIPHYLPESTRKNFFSSYVANPARNVCSDICPAVSGDIGGAENRKDRRHN